MFLAFAGKKKRRVSDTLVDVRVRLFDERAMRFAKLRNARVLIYWPHGFGDFVHLGYLLPLLDASNQYWIARYGDDFSELYRENRFAATLRTGLRSIENPFGTSARDFHLGVNYGSANGNLTTLALTPTLAAGIRENQIDAVLWTDYPDAHGGLRFPYHTKIRSLAQQLVTAERLAQFDTTRRLPHAISFDDVDTEARAYVDRCLSERFGAISQLCLVQSGGHTASKKNWEDSEVLAFSKRFIDEDPRRAVSLLNNVVMPDTLETSRIATWQEVFQSSDGKDAGAHESLAYARVIRAAMTRTALMIGVPAGPTHLALATETTPTVTLWRAHHPLAYEEPNSLARHLVSESALSERSKQWKLTRTVPPFFFGATIEMLQGRVAATTIYDAAENLLRK